MMYNENSPNTRIKVGELKHSDLEKMIHAWKKLNLPAPKGKVPVSIDTINNDNLKLRESEITPDPHFYKNNKLLIHPRYHDDGNLYLHAKIHLGEDSIKNNSEIKEKYNSLIKEYFIQR